MDLVEDNVVVINVESTKEFYVMVPEKKKNEDLYHKKIQLGAENESNPTDIKRGIIYIAKNDKSGFWSRVQVLEILTNKDAVRVFFLDSGSYGVVNIKTLKTCRSELRRLIGLADKCSLHLPSEYLNEQDHIEMNEVLKKLVSDRKSFQMIFKSVTEGASVVDLITTDRLQNFSVTDFLMSICNFPIEPRIQIEMKPIKSLKITNDTFIIVHRVESPSEIYVSMVDMKQDKEVMKIEMTEFYRQNPPNFTILMPGVICATEIDSGTWNRVEVLTSPDCDGWCKVSFIDNGNVESVKWSKLFELDRQFYNFSSFIIRCSLGGVKPVDASWSEDATEFLKNNLMDHEYETKFFGTVENARIYVIQKETKIYINQSLIFFGHAQSTDDEKEPEKVYIPIENVKRDLPSLSLSEKLHPVELVDQENFDSFRFNVKFVQYSGARKTIMEVLQESELRQGNIWNVGDICLARCDVDNEHEQWHRAVITKLQRGVQVMLCEYGIQVTTSISDLRECPAGLKRFKFTTATVKLACNSFSTKKAKEITQSIINSYDQFHINFKDDNTVLFTKHPQPRPAILWGQTSKGIKLNIVRQLEDIGLVKPYNQEEELKDQEEESKDQEEVTPYILPTSKTNVDVSVNPSQEPIVKFKDYEVLMKRQIIDKWLPRLCNTKLKFVGTVTNIDRRGNMVMHEWKHEALLEEMRKLINELFPGSGTVNHKFNVGDPCMVKFDLDNLYYRGKVIGLYNDGIDCNVEFIDYGNTQKGKTKDLFHEVVCVEIPPLAQRYRLEGSPCLVSSSRKIDQDILDRLHLATVDLNIEVKVLAEDANNLIPDCVKRCWIIVDGKLIKSYDDFYANMSEFIVHDPA